MVVTRRTELLKKRESHGIYLYKRASYPAHAKDHSCVGSNVRRAALAVSLGCMMTLIGVAKDGEPLYMTATGSRCLVSAVDVKGQGGHNELEIRPGWSPGFFLIVRSDEGALLYVRSGSYQFVSYGKKYCFHWLLS